MAKFEFEAECRRCQGRGEARNHKTYEWGTCPRCKGKGVTSRKISYAGPVGRAMLAQERAELAEIRRANKAGRLSGTCQFSAQERLKQKGKIVFMHPIRDLIGGWMLSGWRKPLERSYYGTTAPSSGALLRRS